MHVNARVLTDETFSLYSPAMDPQLSIRKLVSIVWVFVGILSVGSAAADTLPDDAYPIADPYLATVLGTPPALRAEIPAFVPLEVQSIERFPDRKLPPVFWSGTELLFGVSKQSGPAPLVFIVAGTGGSWRDRKVTFLRSALYGAGFHVVALPSPMHSSFVAAASDRGIPGLLEDDAEDLLTVMELAREQVANDVPVNGTALVGYSLGATQAAFVGASDAKKKRLGLERIYLINPSVRLFTSAAILDKLFETSLPDGAASVTALVEEGLREAAAYIHSRERARLGSEFVFAAVATGATRGELRGAVAAVFRLAAANLSFSADVVSGGGRIVSPGRKLRAATPLMPYFAESLGWSFTRYLDDILAPHVQQTRGLPRGQLIERAGLAPLATWLATAQHLAVTTNKDDWILEPADLDFLKKAFGERASIHPSGGHCGNIAHAPRVAEMLAFLSQPFRLTKP